MSRPAPLNPAAVLAAREAFLRRHEGFCGNIIAGQNLRDPERVAYLDDTLELAIRAYQRATPQGDLFVRRPDPQRRA